jgi:hypothetical protein
MERNAISSGEWQTTGRWKQQWEMKAGHKQSMEAQSIGAIAAAYICLPFLPPFGRCFASSLAPACLRADMPACLPAVLLRCECDIECLTGLRGDGDDTRHESEKHGDAHLL